MKEDLLVEKPILEINFFEDEEENAKNLFDHLKLPNTYPNYYDDDKQLDQVLINNNSRKVFVVDINLGKNKTSLGLDIIKRIRLVDTSSLIIVYSAHENLKEKCYDLGANFFYHKETETYANDILLIRNILKREMVFNNKEIRKCIYDIWDTKTDIPAKIVNVNNEYITLNCMIDTNKQKIIEKKFSKIIFSELSNLEIDKSIMLTIKERSKRICYNFDDRNIEKVEECFKDKSEGFNIDDLETFNSKELLS